MPLEERGRGGGGCRGGIVGKPRKVPGGDSDPVTEGEDELATLPSWRCQNSTLSDPAKGTVADS